MNGIVNWLKSILRPFGLLKENIKSLIAFEVIFRILTFLVHDLGAEAVADRQ